MATATDSTTIFGVTRSQIMRRAWQLAKLNRRHAGDSPRLRFAEMLSLAWREARTGQTKFWQPVPLVEQLRRSIIEHDAKDQWSKADYAHRAALSDQLAIAAQA